MNTQVTGDHPSPDGPAAPRSLGQLVAALSRHLDAEMIGSGALAELRRITGHVLPPAFWKRYLTDVPPEWREPGGQPNTRLDHAWAALTRAMVEMAPRPHSFDQSFGAALAGTDYSEHRFVRLLRAEGEDLSRELRVAGAWLARAGAKASWEHPAHLLLGAAWRGLDVRSPSSIRHQMARDYFRVAAKQSSSQ